MGKYEIGARPSAGTGVSRRSGPVCGSHDVATPSTSRPHESQTLGFLPAHSSAALMPRRGLEPPHLAAPEPKSGVSTNFTTWA